MSVINRMLRDLEARRDETRPGEGEQVYRDLRPVRDQHRAARSLGMVLVFGVVAAVVVGAWWLVQDRFGTTPSMLVEVRKPEPITVAPRQAAPPTAPKSDAVEETRVAQSAAPAAPPTGQSLSQAEVVPPAPEKSVSPPEGPAPAPAVAVKPVESPRPALPPKATPPAVTADKPKKVAAAPAPVPPAKRPAPKAASPVTPTTSAGIEKTVKPLTPAERAQKEFAVASDLLKAGRVPEAEGHLAGALEADVTHAQAREILVGLKLRQGDVAGAQSLLEAGIAKVPNYYPFVQILARLHVDRGNDAEALTLLERGKAQFAAHPEYLSFYATMLQRTGRHADAVQVYQSVLGMRPSDGRAWLGLGISLEAAGNAAAARKAYERAKATGTLGAALEQYIARRLNAL